MKRKNLKKVDSRIYLIGGFYIVVLILYIFFEKVNGEESTDGLTQNEFMEQLMGSSTPACLEPMDLSTFPREFTLDDLYEWIRKW